MMTVENTNDIERVQKNVVRMILGKRFTNYEEGLTFLELETLVERREKLCLTFALKCLASHKYKDWFQLTPKTDNYLRETRKLLEPQCQTDRYRNSPKVYLTRILNEYFSNQNS